MLDRPSTELLGDAFLVVRAGVGGVPAFLEAANRQNRVTLRNCITNCRCRHLDRLLVQLRPVTYRAICDLTHLRN